MENEVFKRKTRRLDGLNCFNQIITNPFFLHSKTNANQIDFSYKRLTKNDRRFQNVCHLGITYRLFLTVYTEGGQCLIL
jgi:hypothetical protein